MYCKLFLKQCHQLHDILPGLFEADSDYMEILFGISYTNKDDVIYMLVNPETGIPENDFNVSALDKKVIQPDRWRLLVGCISITIPN